MKKYIPLLSLLFLTPLVVAKEKGKASSEGLNRATARVEIKKAALKKLTVVQLVNEFVESPRGKSRYGGFNYYYGFMYNNALIDELKSRGEAIHGDLKLHFKNKKLLAQAISGKRGYTVGFVCKQIVEGN